MRAYLLRDIDPALWARVHSSAKDDGIPLRTVILKLLELYAGGMIRITATAGGNDPDK